MYLEIKKMREEKGLSQRGLADMVGVTHAAVHQWETGLADPSLKNLVSLADALECSTDAVLGRNAQTSA